VSNKNRIELENPPHIPFHKPFTISNEISVLTEAVLTGKWEKESEEVNQFFQNYYKQSTCFLTNSCSSALEIAIRVLGIGEGDEVIIPAFGYVAVANAVVNNGAKPVFADVSPHDGNINVESISERISPQTRAIIAIHYAGNSFNVNAIKELCAIHQIFLIEDAAQCIGSFFDDKPLGSFGHISCLSFDYMKNISCGQGGLLIVNDPKQLHNVRTYHDNGTNRQSLREGLTSGFEWVSKGGNNQINPLATHFLIEQLKGFKQITNTRLSNWEQYRKGLAPLQMLGKATLPNPILGHNGHIFYLILPSNAEREELKKHLREKSIYAEHHYTSLVKSEFGRKFIDTNFAAPYAEKLCSQLLRLPLWNNISSEEINLVIKSINEFYNV
jgi:dTDP-4-amino-4,6-dideoxygalactose transaminase